jgi:hypothetical protein
MRYFVASVLLIAGFLCFAFVAIDQVLEVFGMFPAFGWGQPHGIGHYLNLIAALLGVVLLCAGLPSGSPEAEATPSRLR